MIPNCNNLNNYNNQIKIQLTNDNKCIIHTLSESPIKSQNTIIKDDYSINEDMSLSKSNSIIKNNPRIDKNKILSNSNNKNNNINILNDLGDNSNLLISFSNISEVTKVNNEYSLTKINSYKNNSLLMNKDLVLNNNNIAGNSFLSNQMQILTGDKNVTINNINNYNIANSDGNSIISNNNFFISNEKNNKYNFNNDINSTIKTPSKIYNSSNINKIDSTNNKRTNNNDSKSINKQLINSFNRNDFSELVNLNIDDKSENYDKVNIVNSDKKSFNTSNNLNSTTSIKICSDNVSPKQNKKIFNNKVNNLKYFKNCVIQKNEVINIIQTIEQTNKTNNDSNKIDKLNNNNINNKNIIPKHCANFSFSGNIQKNSESQGFEDNLLINKDNQEDTKKSNMPNNAQDKNDDYVSPTFNLNLNYNSLEKDKNNNTNNKNNPNEYLKGKENKVNNDKKLDNTTTNATNAVSINSKQKERNSNGPSVILKLPNDVSSGSTIEITDKNKKENKKNNDTINHDSNNVGNNGVAKISKQQDKNILINSNLNSKNNTISKKSKENEVNSCKPQNLNNQKNSANNNNNNNNMNSNINNNQAKIKKISNVVNNNNKNKNSMQNKVINKDNLINNNLKNKIIKTSINTKSNIGNSNEKCNHIVVCKKCQNSRYKHSNIDSLSINNNIKYLYNSMTESDKKSQKLSISHNKSKSGMGSIIKFNSRDTNIINIKSGNILKGSFHYKKKYKSISPTIQRKNGHNTIIKEKNKIQIKSKSQSRSKTKTKSKYNNNTSKQKSLKEKMDIILSKNIIALTKKTRKSPSPKIRISRPSFIKNVGNNLKDKIFENMRLNNNFGNNIYYNGTMTKKNKNSPSPLSFRNSNNNTNSIYNSHTINNKDNLVILNKKTYGPRKKVIGNSPKYSAINQNSSEHFEKMSDKLCHQHSLSNKKQNLAFKNRSSLTHNNNNGSQNKKILNKKSKNIKDINIFKFDDEYNSLNDRKKNNNNTIFQQGNKKRRNNSKNSFVGNVITSNKNLGINNIKMNNKNAKRQMTIIQNFSKYMKKPNLNMNNNYIKKNGQNENISNNLFEDNKIISEGNETKNNKNINANRTIDEKGKKSEYNHSQPKITDSNNCYTN